MQMYMSSKLRKIQKKVQPMTAPVDALQLMTAVVRYYGASGVEDPDDVAAHLGYDPAHARARNRH